MISLGELHDRSSLGGGCARMSSLVIFLIRCHGSVEDLLEDRLGFRRRASVRGCGGSLVHSGYKSVCLLVVESEVCPRLCCQLENTWGIALCVCVNGHAVTGFRTIIDAQR
jgi:hypothetical protein